MNVVSVVGLVAVACAAALCLARLVRGPSLADRIVALDALLIMLVSGVAVDAARTGVGTYVDLLIVTALLGFVGAVLVARYIEQRGT